jgi:hypothetical protein
MCNFITGPVHYGFCVSLILFIILFKILFKFFLTLKVIFLLKKCDGCHMDPIIGTRYLCNECDESHEVDLCEECFVEESFEKGKF